MMNQYKIESYIADGETMSVSRVVYADTPEEAYRQYVISVGEKNEDGTKKFEINGDTYYLIQSYTKLTLYKNFNSKFYYIINEWNLKNEVYKRNNVIEFETNRYYVRFIDSDYSMKLVIPKIDENLELVLEYENQKR